MKEVARVADVSLATVSRVINGTGEVRPDLAERVHDAVKLLGYRRDLTASTLRRADRQSASIGLIIEDVSNPFFSAVHRGVEDVARPHGVLTFVGSSDEKPARERELAEAFGARGVDGLVIVPCASDQSYLMRDHQAGTALVFVDRPPRFMPGDAVVSDNRGGARAAVEHLIAAGHRRIAFLGDRLVGLHRRRAPRRLPPGARGAGIARARRSSAPSSSTASSPQAARRASCCAPDDPPTALFTGQNLITIGAIRALRELGLQREVALVGFDDVVLGDLVEPGITVVAQDPYALGRHAGELLFAGWRPRDRAQRGRARRS